MNCFCDGSAIGVVEDSYESNKILFTLFEESESNSDESNSDESNSDESNSDETDSDESDSDESKSDESDSNESKSDEIKKVRDFARCGDCEGEQEDLVHN